jgi:vacuolar-type H+-ATPase catalytic subunit A/Vma1
MAGKKEHQWPWKKIKKGVPANPLGTGPTGSRPAAPAKGQGGTASLPGSSGSASAFAKNRLLSHANPDMKKICFCSER